MMKKTLLLTLAGFFAIATFAQPRSEFNRYGIFLKKQSGKYVVPNEVAFVRTFGCDPATIEGWNELYIYTPEKIRSEDYRRCSVTSYVYKSHPGYECRMDVYLPKGQGDGPFPYVLFIHGGGWRRGTEKDMGHFACYYASHGIASVSVSYTLSGQGTFEETRADLLDAKTFVDSHAGEWGIDASRFGFFGFSAGGHLSSYMGMTVPGTKVMVSIAGAHDLTPNGARKSQVNPDLEGYFRVKEDAENLRRYSPRYLIPDAIPAVMLVHGTFDLAVPPSQSSDFRDALNAAGAKQVELILEPYSQHVVLGRGRVHSYERNMLRVFEFVRRNL